MWLGIGIKIVNWLWRGPSGPFNGHATLTNDLVSAWPLSEDGFDSHGTNDLTNNNGVTFVAKGGGAPANMPGTVAKFVAASSQYFSHADPGLDFTTVASFSWWEYRTDLSINQTAFAKWTYNTDGGYAVVHGDNAAAGADDFLVYIATSAGDDGSGCRITFNAEQSAATWYHMVLIYDGSAVGDAARLRLFQNTSELAQISVIGAVPATMIDSGAAFELGRFAGLGRFANGLISSPEIWSRVLTAGERTDLYNSGNGLFY